MKKVIVTFLVLLMLCGCNNVQPTSPASDMDYIDEMVSSLPASDDEISEEVPSVAEYRTENATSEIAYGEVIIDENTEPNIAGTPTQTQAINTAETIPSEPSAPTIQGKKQEECVPDTVPQSDESPSESQPVAVEDIAQETEPTAPKSIYDYEFDATAIRQELMTIGIEMGLEVDSSFTPNNASWANSITASRRFHGANLERSLKDYVRSMPSLIVAYGGEPIHYFSIYVEQIGDGSYCFYFLY